jgi:hypothetical protein
MQTCVLWKEILASYIKKYKVINIKGYDVKWFLHCASTIQLSLQRVT